MVEVSSGYALRKENDIMQLLLKCSVDLKAVFKVLTFHLLQLDVQTIQETARDIQSRIERFKAHRQRLDQTSE